MSSRVMCCPVLGESDILLELGSRRFIRAWTRAGRPSAGHGSSSRGSLTRGDDDAQSGCHMYNLTHHAAGPGLDGSEAILHRAWISRTVMEIGGKACGWLQGRREMSVAFDLVNDSSMEQCCVASAWRSALLPIGWKLACSRSSGDVSLDV